MKGRIWALHDRHVMRGQTVNDLTWIRYYQCRVKWMMDSVIS